MISWNELSEQYAGINETKTRIAFRQLLERLEEEPPRVLLDYGTGDGRFPELCSHLRIRQIWAYDPAPRMAQLAHARCRNLPTVRVITDTDAIEAGSVDLATVNAVWMCLPTEGSCMAMLRDISRLLKTDGRLIASVTHPCFRTVSFSTYSAEFNQRDYLRAGVPFRVNLFDGNRTMEIEDIHWSLTAMSRQLKEAGFCIEEILETPDEPYVPAPCEGSPWLILFARKR